MSSLKETTTGWIKQQDWLTSEHELLVTALQMAAAALDEQFRASSMAEYRRLYESLVLMKPVETDDETDDDLTAL